MFPPAREIASARPGATHPSEYVFERVVPAQFVELDIFFEAFERRLAGELLQSGDMHALRDTARDGTAPEAVAGEGGVVEPG